MGEHFHLFQSSLISFNMVCSFERRGFAHLLLNLFLCIIFDSIVKGMIFFISCLGYLLLVHSRNTVDFPMLILCPAALINSLINPSSLVCVCVCVCSLDFLHNGSWHMQDLSF